MIIGITALRFSVLAFYNVNRWRTTWGVCLVTHRLRFRICVCSTGLLVSPARTHLVAGLHGTKAPVPHTGVMLIPSLSSLCILKSCVTSFYFRWQLSIRIMAVISQRPYNRSTFLLVYFSTAWISATGCTFICNQNHCPGQISLWLSSVLGLYLLPIFDNILRNLAND